MRMREGGSDARAVGRRGKSLDPRVRGDDEQKRGARGGGSKRMRGKAPRMLVQSAGAVSHWIPVFAGMTSKSGVRSGGGSKLPRGKAPRMLVHSARHARAVGRRGKSLDPRVRGDDEQERGARGGGSTRMRGKAARMLVRWAGTPA